MGPGTLEQIVGCGVDLELGRLVGEHPAEASVPIVADATCDADSAATSTRRPDRRLPAAAGHVPGDSGGPMFAAQRLPMRVVGATQLGGGLRPPNRPASTPASATSSCVSGSGRRTRTASARRYSAQWLWPPRFHIHIAARAAHLGWYGECLRYGVVLQVRGMNWYSPAAPELEFVDAPVVARLAVRDVERLAARLARSGAPRG